MKILYLHYYLPKIKSIIMKSKIFITIFTLTLAAFLASSCKNRNSGEADQNASTNETTETKADTTLAFNPSDLPESPLFSINTTEGNIVIRLYKETPLHRDNFIKLASKRYFDGVLFHRVIYNFMIQTGDPLTKDSTKAAQYGTGGPDYTIPAEIKAQFTHKKGAVAAARRGDAANPLKESSGSQFYIVHNPDYCKHLDGEYTIFGETVEGFEVIDKIAAMKTGEKDRPLKDVRIISVMPVIQTADQ